MKNKFRIVFYFCLFLLLFFAFVFKANADKFFGNLANYYYANNKFEKAQFYYEKAFNLGNKSINLREAYTNSIINSPLNIASQEKLVKIAEGEVEDSATTTAKYFLYNLKREIHNKYPLNYIKQAPFNQKIMHWGKLPITYAFRNQNLAPKEFTEEINNAFNEWERVSSGRIKFQNVKTPIADILIDYQSNLKEKDVEDGQKYVVAYTVPIVSQNKLKNMVMKFNLKDPEGKDFTPNQIYNTALHEAFHALGFMGHSFDKTNIMYMSKNSDSFANDQKQKLTEADKMTFELLYKIKPDITNAEELEYDYIPYLILGDSAEVSYSKTREAKNYIRKAPMLPGGYIDLAESYVAQKNYPQAIKTLEKALRLSRDNDTKYIIYYNLAVSYYYIGTYEMALDYVELAAAIKDLEELHLLKAELYFKQENYNLAATEYETLLKRDPSNIDYTVNLATIYVKNHDYLKARKIIKMFIKNNPKEKNNQKFEQFGVLNF